MSICRRRDRARTRSLYHCIDIADISVSIHIDIVDNTNTLIIFFRALVPGIRHAAADWQQAVLSEPRGACVWSHLPLHGCGLHIPLFPSALWEP